MNLTSELLTPGLIWTGNCLFLIALAVALWQAPWWHARIGADTNVLLASCVALLGIWSIKGGVLPGLSLHLLGATLLTLMFGWQFALIALSLVLTGSTFNGDAGWWAFGWNGLIMAALPVAVSEHWLRLVQRRLPSNFFVYVFVAAFFGAALSLSCACLAGALLLWLGDAYTLDQVRQNFINSLMLLLFPEAFLTGALLSIFVVYRPTWVASFDDARYFHNSSE